MAFLRAFEGFLLLLLRLALGGLFLWAAYVKLDNPQAFADSIKGFRLLDESGDHLVTLATFALPWIEAIAGALLVLGLWTRGSAAVLLLNLAAFSGAIYSVLARGISTKCGCFGKFSPFCPEEITRCNLIQNAALAAIALLLLLRGGGLFGLDGRPPPKTKGPGKPENSLYGAVAPHTPPAPRPAQSIKQVAAARAQAPTPSTSPPTPRPPQSPPPKAR